MSPVSGFSVPLFSCLRLPYSLQELVSLSYTEASWALFIGGCGCSCIPQRSLATEETHQHSSWPEQTLDRDSVYLAKQEGFFCCVVFVVF